MAVGIETPPDVASPRLLRERRLTVDHYLRMIESGVVGDEDPVFLWKGRIVEKMSKNWPHMKAMTQLATLLFRVILPGHFLWSEQPIVLGDDSMPEPDFTIVRGAVADYGPHRRPSARDVALVVEVADSTLAEDQGEALEAYAAEGIPIYWIVNLRAGTLEVYTNPTGPADHPRYGDLVVLGAEDQVPLVLDGVEVARLAVRDILP